MVLLYLANSMLIHKPGFQINDIYLIIILKYHNFEENIWCSNKHVLGFVMSLVYHSGHTCYIELGKKNTVCLDTESC